VKARDVVMASGLVDYFKVHAYRVHVGLHARNSEDLLAVGLAQFLQEHGGLWEGEPSDLWQALRRRGSESVPGRADELSKKVRTWARQGTWLTLGDKEWDKKGTGNSRRNLSLRLANGVDGVVGVDQDHV
jgi:hypothetical protein